MNQTNQTNKPNKFNKTKWIAIIVIILWMICAWILTVVNNNAHAATPVDLNRQPISFLSNIAAPTAIANSAITLKEINRSVDFNQTLHIRVQEMYFDYPVWGGDAIIHIPQGEKLTQTLNAQSLLSIARSAQQQQGSMNGVMYLNIAPDVARTNAIIFNQLQAQKALQQALNLYQQQMHAMMTIKNPTIQLIIYIDKNHRAHWAYKINFFAWVPGRRGVPASPIYILDAMTFYVYAYWNDLKTIATTTAATTTRENVLAGGYGGNNKMGKLSYDGKSGSNHLSKLFMQRDPATKTCFFQNANANIKKCVINNTDCLETIDFTLFCSEPHPGYDNIYWNGSLDAVNGGYSPSNDALFNTSVVNAMYQQWYGVSALANHIPLIAVVHLPIDDAYWYQQQIYIGDGKNTFYPLTSLAVTAHEAAHGFTEQYSNLNMLGSESGAINEAFADMAAKAAEFYVYKKDLHWEIAPEIFKATNKALRYMDKPSKNCYGGEPGIGCSIDHVDQMEEEGIDAHFASGIYDRAFYLLSTSPNWTTQKAFNVMTKANMQYWTASESFASGACGVIKATHDYAKTDSTYKVTDVESAFAMVGVATSQCM